MSKTNQRNQGLGTLARTALLAAMASVIMIPAAAASGGSAHHTHAISTQSTKTSSMRTASLRALQFCSCYYNYGVSGCTATCGSSFGGISDSCVFNINAYGTATSGQCTYSGICNGVIGLSGNGFLSCSFNGCTISASVSDFAPSFSYSAACFPGAPPSIGYTGPNPIGVTPNSLTMNNAANQTSFNGTNLINATGGDTGQALITSHYSTSNRDWINQQQGLLNPPNTPAAMAHCAGGSDWCPGANGNGPQIMAMDGTQSYQLPNGDTVLRYANGSMAIKDPNGNTIQQWSPPQGQAMVYRGYENEGTTYSPPQNASNGLGAFSNKIQPTGTSYGPPNDATYQQITQGSVASIGGVGTIQPNPWNFPGTQPVPKPPIAPISPPSGGIGGGGIHQGTPVAPPPPSPAPAAPVAPGLVRCAHAWAPYFNAATNNCYHSRRACLAAEPWHKDAEGCSYAAGPSGR